MSKSQFSKKSSVFSKDRSRLNSRDTNIETMLNDSKRFVKIVDVNDGHMIFVKTNPMTIIFKDENGGKFLITKIKKNITKKIWKANTEQFAEIGGIKKIIDNLQSNTLLPFESYGKILEHNGGEVIALRAIEEALLERCVPIMLISSEKFETNVEINSFELSPSWFSNRKEVGFINIWSFSPKYFKFSIPWQMHVYYGGVNRKMYDDPEYIKFSENREAIFKHEINPEDL